MLGILSTQKADWFAIDEANIYFYYSVWQMQNELSVKKVSIQTCHLTGGTIMLLLQFSFWFPLGHPLMFHMKVHLWGKCTQWGHWACTLPSYYELNDSSRVLGVWIYALGLHCGQKKQSCPPPKIWLHLPATSLLGAGHLGWGEGFVSVCLNTFPFQDFVFQLDQQASLALHLTLWWPVPTQESWWRCMAGRKETQIGLNWSWKQIL